MCETSRPPRHIPAVHRYNKSFLRAGHVDVQRVVDGEVDLRRTSTSELACDAGTSGTLSAGDLSWCCELEHLLFSWCAAESLRELQILRPLYLSCSQPRSSFRLGSRWFDDARRASSNHVVAARRGRTAWTGEVHQAT